MKNTTGTVCRILQAIQVENKSFHEIGEHKEWHGEGYSVNWNTKNDMGRGIVSIGTQRVAWGGV